MSTKVQCDLCKLSYSSEKELLHHSLTLMHHTKLEDKEKNPLHECPLCSTVCSNMADYRRHITTDAHQKNLSDFKGVKNRKNDISDSRKSFQISEMSYPSSSWLDDATLNDSNEKQYLTEINAHGNRVEDQYSRQNDHRVKNHQNGSHLRFDHAQRDLWDSDSWKSRYNYRNDIYHWSRDDYQNSEHNRDLRRQDDLEIPHNKKNGNSHSEGKFLPSSGELSNSGRHSEASGWKRDEERIKISVPVYSCGLDVPGNMDFTSDVVPTDWDENSFLEHEQFLHGVDTAYHDSNRSHSDRFHSDRFHSHPASNRIVAGKWDESSVRDRKRPRNEDDVQELLAKSSRSINSSLDEYFPVRDVPTRNSGVFSTSASHEVKQATDSFSDFKKQTQISNMDNASNNILERAERLCKELRQKREASEGQKNVHATKQSQEPLNQKMSALLQKQQLDYKANVLNSKKIQSEESCNSSAKQLQANSKVVVPPSKKSSVNSDTPEMQGRATDKKLFGLKKSVEKRIVENQKTRASSTAVLLKPKQRSLSGGDVDLEKTKKRKDGLTDVVGKPMLNPMSKLLLNKDNLKKMVNTPNSRDERLQLVKMLHSRMEQKTATAGAPRTHVQLEGLYDSLFTTDDVNLDLGQTCDSQTIKLENLSEGVRQQILDLIGSDVSSQSVKHPGTALKSANGRKKTPQDDVIVLSDDEVFRNIRKTKKSAARKMSVSSTSNVLDDAAKTNKKKKLLAKPSFDVDSRNSLSSFNSDSSVTHQAHTYRPTSPVQRSNKLNKYTSLHSAKILLYDSRTSDLERHKGKDTFRKERSFHDSSNTLLTNKQNSVVISSNRVWKNEAGLNIKHESQFDSCSIREKFPTLLKIPKSDRAPPVNINGTLVSSEAASSTFLSHQNSADKNSEVSPAYLNFEADIKTVSTKIQVKPTLIKTDEKTLFTEASAEMASLEAQKSNKSASLPSKLLTKNPSPLQSYEIEHIFTNRSSVSSDASHLSDIPSFSPAFKETSFKDTPDRDLLDDMDYSTIGDGRAVTSNDSVGTSSQTMTTLLILSEKEEYVKQEKMSMDLRLSRLHKLLEQAVVQINKCTERMNKLHEEEQELLKKRLTLLRVATSSQPKQRYNVLSENKTNFEVKPFANSESHGADFHITHLTSDSGTRSFDISLSSTSPTLLRTGTEHVTSLSKADWLAKFSSFLPQDSVKEDSKITPESTSLDNRFVLKDQPQLSYNSLPRDAVLTKLNISNSQPERDILSETVDVDMDSEKTNKSSFKFGLSDSLSQVSSSAVVSEQKGGFESQTVERSAHSLPVTSESEPVIHSRISAPIMYVGSFRSTDQSMRLISPFVLERPDNRPVNPFAETSNIFDSDRNLRLTNCQGREDSDIPTHDSVFADLRHLPSPPISHTMRKNSEFGGEESDIGSVASSMASGSSLGEQITLYCQSTPGASLDSRDPHGAHELSVIMSDTSEQRAVDSSPEEENDKSDTWLPQARWPSDVRPCSVSLERLNRKSTSIYDSLDEKSARSVEVLHLTERNYEDMVSQSGRGLDNEKRRKRKTKLERDTTGFTQRRTHWITLSSSEDEEDGSSQHRFSSDINTAVFRSKKNGLSSCVEKIDHNVLNTEENNKISDCDDVILVDHQSGNERTNGSDVIIDNMKFLSPSKSASYLDLTVAECDSSTSIGAVDSESNFQHRNQKEMRKEFDHLPDLSPKSSSPDTYHSINSSVTDVIAGRNGSRLNRPEYVSSLSLKPFSDSSLPLKADSLNKRFGRTSQSYERPERTSQLYERPERTSQPYERPVRTSPSYELTETTSPPYELPERTSQPYERLERTSPSYELTERTSPPYELPDRTSPPYELPDRTSHPYELPERKSQLYELPVHSTLNESKNSGYVQRTISPFDWKTSLDFDEEINSSSARRSSCLFPGSYGPVFDIQVVKGQMYVGHSNRCVRVYNFNGLSQSTAVKEYPFDYLQCMTFKERDEAVTLILGSGSDLVFCNSNEHSQQRYNLGTTIKCLLLLSHLVYAGLDTGEICKFDTLRMVLKDRCICSDHPIHCLASGKEGAVKLLCVSSQDGTIIVVDAQQFLPIRILRGHSKTAFSIQIEGHLVFSGSGDHTVLIQNLHTADVEHVYSDSKGLVKSICYSKGYLFTGGMDKLVRCYDVKTHKLVQVYYGADRGVVTKILVLDNRLITGNISGSVDVVDIDIEAKHRCQIAGCTLTFGNQPHLYWHMLEDHSTEG